MNVYTGTCTYKENEYPVNLLMDIFRSNDPPLTVYSQPGKMRHILDTLPERERTAISLRYQQRMSSSEIGASLGISRRSALLLVQKGLRLLRHPVRYTLCLTAEFVSGQ